MADPTNGENSLIQVLESQCLSRHCEIENWFRNQWQLTPPPFYSSVDLRNANFKLAPVDTNLFPAGFNNLNLSSINLAIQSVQVLIGKRYPNATSFLIMADSNTRHEPYFINVFTLASIISKAGFDVRVGTVLPLTAPKKIHLSEGRTLTIYPVKRQGDKLVTENFNPDVILLNDDLSAGSPADLQDLSQIVTPNLDLGWFYRRKSQHFSYYNNVAIQFSELINIDPWLINPYFEVCHNVDFVNGVGLDCLEKSIEKVLTQTQKKYDEYHIKREPFVVVKADAGTYGMGITMVKSPEDIKRLNRKERMKMSQLKGGQVADQVLVQEGVYTVETTGNNHSVAEPVVYMMGEYVVGGFYRVHHQKGPDENLNTPGMEFEPLVFSNEDQEHGRLYVYGLIARLALLAAAHEFKTGNIL